MRFKAGCFIFMAIALVVGLTIFFNHYRRQLLWVHQQYNKRLFNHYFLALKYYREIHGEFPPALDRLPPVHGLEPEQIRDGRDVWGHAIHYETDGAGYILVSYGRDGNPDGLDAWELREENLQDRKRTDICFDWDADQVMSDRGWHRVCAGVPRRHATDGGGGG